MNKILKTAFIILVFVNTFCPAEETENSFGSDFGTVASYNKPFWADMHSTLIRAEAAYATNSSDYDWGGLNKAYRPYIFANLGADIPVWSSEYHAKKLGFCVTMPFIIDVWFDRFEWQTSPVIHNSYRFSLFDFGFICRRESPAFIKNYCAKLSLFKHESTHIGDELTIIRKDKDFPITRIDVAYNFLEGIFTINDPDNQPHQNHGFKLGFLFIYNYKKGRYKIFDTEANADLYRPSTFPFEFFVQYQYQTALFGKGFQVIASAEYRLRERHKYPYYISGSLSDPVLNNPDINLVHCVNLLAGIRYDNRKQNYFSKTGIGIHYYYGLNPHGQFRSMPDFRQFGVSLFFE